VCENHPGIVYGVADGGFLLIAELLLELQVAF
jgi:hypothetical protein